MSLNSDRGMADLSYQFVKFGPCSRHGCIGTATGIIGRKSSPIDETLYCTPCGKKVAASRNRMKRNAGLRGTK